MSTDNRSTNAAHGEVPLLVPDVEEVEIRKLVSPELFEHLKLEAKSQGISMRAAYLQELEARVALDSLGDDEQFLSKAEAKSKWPEKYLTRDEQKPF